MAQIVGELAELKGLSPLSKEFADLLDSQDELSNLQDQFLFPDVPKHTESHSLSGSEKKRNKAIYLCGNSLGIQPRGLKAELLKQLDKWEHQGVEGHFTEPTPWLVIDEIATHSMARLVGALPSEVVMMNSLTCNLHFMMAAFYKPTKHRNKIVIEKKAFPSDIHAVVSQILHHNLNPKDCLIEIAPREGETLLRNEDIEEVLLREGESIALILFSGIQYYTGQLFDMARITSLGHAQGCKVGFDLAHAVGNVPLQLHEWGCNFACWCTYKYMNCGPGSIGGCFVHERHGKASGSMSPQSTLLNEDDGDGRESVDPMVNPTRLAGWWGHKIEDRFVMAPEFRPCEGAHGYRLSNPPVLLMACVRASLDLFDLAGGMEKLRAKSILLTGYLELLLTSELGSHVQIFTPKDPQQRGCQLSLSFTG